MLTDETILEIVKKAPALDTAEAEWIYVARAIYAKALKDAAEVCAAHASCEGIAQTCAAAILALGKE